MSAPVTHVDPRDRPECQRYEVLISTPLATIRTLPKDELVKRYDELLVLEHPPCQVQRLYFVGPDDYRDELTRRTTERHTTQVEAYAKKLDQQTTALICLTRILAVLTAGLFALKVLRISGAAH